MTAVHIFARGWSDERNQKLHDLGQSIWLDNITRDLLNSGTLKRYIDELSVTGLTSNPTIFDHAIKNSTTYDDAIRQKVRGGPIRRGAVLRSGAGGSDPGRRPVQADLRAHRRRRRLGLAGGVAAAGARHRQHAGGGQGAARAGRAAQSVHQDSRHQGRLARHRGGDLRRRPDQRHAAVLARAIRGGGRGLSARRRAAHRRRAQSRRRLGRLGVHQPVGCRGRGQGARGAGQPAGYRHRPAHLQGLPRSARLGALAAGGQRGCARRSGCCGPAPAPRIRRRPTFSTSRRLPRRSPSTRCPRAR